MIRGLWNKAVTVKNRATGRWKSVNVLKNHTKKPKGELELKRYQHQFPSTSFDNAKEHRKQLLEGSNKKTSNIWHLNASNGQQTTNANYQMKYQSKFKQTGDVQLLDVTKLPLPVYMPTKKISTSSGIEQIQNSTEKKTAILDTIDAVPGRCTTVTYRVTNAEENRRIAIEYRKKNAHGEKFTYRKKNALMDRYVSGSYRKMNVPWDGYASATYRKKKALRDRFASAVYRDRHALGHKFITVPYRKKTALVDKCTSATCGKRNAKCDSYTSAVCRKKNALRDELTTARYRYRKKHACKDRYTSIAYRKKNSSRDRYPSSIYRKKNAIRDRYASDVNRKKNVLRKRFASAMYRQENAVRYRYASVINRKKIALRERYASATSRKNNALKERYSSATSRKLNALKDRYSSATSRKKNALKDRYSTTTSRKKNALKDRYLSATSRKKNALKFRYSSAASRKKNPLKYRYSSATSRKKNALKDTYSSTTPRKRNADATFRKKIALKNRYISSVPQKTQNVKQTNQKPKEQGTHFRTRNRGKQQLLQESKRGREQKKHRRRSKERSISKLSGANNQCTSHVKQPGKPPTTSNVHPKKVTEQDSQPNVDKNDEYRTEFAADNITRANNSHTTIQVGKCNPGMLYMVLLLFGQLDKTDAVLVWKEDGFRIVVESGETITICICITVIISLVIIGKYTNNCVRIYYNRRELEVNDYGVHVQNAKNFGDRVNENLDIHERKMLHVAVYEYISENIPYETDIWERFILYLKELYQVGNADIAKAQTVVPLLHVLFDNNKIGIGEYDVLIEIFIKMKMKRIADKITELQNKIRRIRDNGKSDAGGSVQFVNECK